MSTPRIRYTITGVQTLDFEEDLSEMEITYPRTVLSNIAAAGPEERLNVRQDCFVTVAWDYVVKLQGVGSGGSDAELKRRLRSFFSVAQRKHIPWTFARDANETVLTELAAPASAGATEVVVDSATGITVGKVYVIRNDRDIDIVEVASVAGTTIGLADELAFDFLACDRFRSEQYWPGVYLIGEEPVVELPPLHYGLRFRFREEYP